jgi:hypothetical protein
VYRQPPADELTDYKYAELDTTYNKQGISKASAGNFAEALELFRSVGSDPSFPLFSPTHAYKKNNAWRHPPAFQVPAPMMLLLTTNGALPLLLRSHHYYDSPAPHLITIHTAVISGQTLGWLCWTWSVEMTRSPLPR